MFPVAYSCTLTGGPTDEPDTLNVTLGQAVVAGGADPDRIGVHVHRDARVPAR